MGVQQTMNTNSLVEKKRTGRKVESTSVPMKRPTDQPTDEPSASVPQAPPLTVFSHEQVVSEEEEEQVVVVVVVAVMVVLSVEEEKEVERADNAAQCPPTPRILVGIHPPLDTPSTVENIHKREKVATSAGLSVRQCD
ncbi:hypothetical protein M0804_008381 [Polistes exclamans]|nr:hypothetical protein M0804_008381 [Polistes exclamans]